MIASSSCHCTERLQTKVDAAHVLQNQLAAKLNAVCQHHITSHHITSHHAQHLQVEAASGREALGRLQQEHTTLLEALKQVTTHHPAPHHPHPLQAHARQDELHSQHAETLRQLASVRADYASLQRAQHTQRLDLHGTTALRDENASLRRQLTEAQHAMHALRQQHQDTLERLQLRVLVLEDQCGSDVERGAPEVETVKRRKLDTEPLPEFPLLPQWQCDLCAGACML